MEAIFPIWILEGFREQETQSGYDRSSIGTSIVRELFVGFSLVILYQSVGRLRGNDAIGFIWNTGQADQFNEFEEYKILLLANTDVLDLTPVLWIRIFEWYF